MSAWLLRMAERLRWGSRLQSAVALAPLVVVVGVGLADALTKSYDARESWACLGHWVQQEYGPSPSLIGPEGLATTANYYARGRCRVLADPVGDNGVVRAARRFDPDVVLLWAWQTRSRRGKTLVKRIEKLGFSHIDHSGLPPGTERVFVLAQGHADPRVARNPARKSGRIEAGLAHDW